jgi:class 3 adenylate cyclase
LEHEARPGQILLSDKTLRLVAGFVATAREASCSCAASPIR